MNTTVGTVSMENTYPAWIDPTFTRMRPIIIFNNGQETFHDYDVNITVLYDVDMQSDFDDLRFTDQTGDSSRIIDSTKSMVSPARSL